MKIALVINYEFDSDYIEAIKQLTKLPLLESSEQDEFTHILCLEDSGLALKRLGLKTGENQKQSTRVDFQDSTLLYRKNSFGKQQGLAKAVGLNKHEPMQVLDATAGLGRDAFILASMGCQVSMLEQSLIIYSLLLDGFKRAEAVEDEALKSIMQNMSLHQAAAQDWFTEIIEGKKEQPDVIYLDPMFPPRNKNANVKKDIALLQEILGFDEDNDSLLEAARNCAKHRVVVKKPGSKVSKGGIKPSFVVPGKTAHFEVFV
ncbi:MAG: 16S rRNA methyltransferase [SAR86 cluster bacterium]|uniref:Ribosomal RNA small subunit methyltransferase J n=1 Tax=SAR86 cluster bacterium TaxID=2030880 RepID=A0A2A5CAA8_9GAMM|nr:class I SAM-dependent methyltransferase [Gammaproteobacteria bacterium AH-315-E17]PCJ40380.1 MAG: 16S rRNA methyltransferase [SAR86 cluster bacterium]